MKIINSRSNLRRFLSILIGLILFILAANWLMSYLTEGNLEISTAPTNLITLTKTVDKAENVYVATGSFLKTAHGSLSIRLKTGDYAISIQGNSVATAKIAKITAHSTNKIDLSPPNATAVEVVANKKAENISADNTHIFYVNPDSHSLNKIDGQNILSNVDYNIPLQTVKWADPSYGIGNDSNGHLYVIKNGVISPLSAGVQNNIRFSSYAVTPTRDIYATAGNDVYLSTAGARFKNIYSLPSKSSSVITGPGSIALINNPNGQDRSSKQGLIIINNGGNITKRNMAASAAAWSVSGNYLAVSFLGLHSGEILDGSLRHVAFIPQSKISNLEWVDNGTLLYSINDQLWSYDLNSQKTDLIANMPLGSVINNLVINSDKSYAYLHITGVNGGSLVRVGLRGQKTSATVSQLQIVLPRSLDHCYLSLVNFTKPTVIVEPDLVTQPPTLCIQDANNELTQDGVDLSGVTIQLAPVLHLVNEP